MTTDEKKMMLLPPKPGFCQECAADHEPEIPHNQQSLFYQTKFQIEYGRAPTWADAMAHCTPKMRRIWKEELARKGVKV